MASLNYDKQEKKLILETMKVKKKLQKNMMNMQLNIMVIKLRQIFIMKGINKAQIN